MTFQNMALAFKFFSQEYRRMQHKQPIAMLLNLPSLHLPNEKKA